MIKKTKRSISNYGNNVNQLNKDVKGVNTGMKKVGYGVDNYLFDNLQGKIKKNLRKLQNWYLIIFQIIYQNFP